MKKELGVVVLLFSLLAVMSYWPVKSDSALEAEIRSRTVKIEIVNHPYTVKASTVTVEEGLLKTKYSSKIPYTIQPLIDNDEENGGTIYGCTGTNVGHGYIITNAHCFEGEFKTRSIIVRKYEQSSYKPAILLSIDTKRDFALLYSKEYGQKTQPVKMATNLGMTDSIYLLGNPAQGDFIKGKSRVIGFMTVFTPKPMRYLRTMVWYPCDTGGPGFSGGGVYNSKGEYVGMHELGQQIPIFYDILSKLAGHEVQGPLCYAIPSQEFIDAGLDRPWEAHKRLSLTKH